MTGWCGGTCPYGRLIVVWMGFLVSRSRQVEHVVQGQIGVRGLGQENVLVGCGGDQSLGQLNVLGVHGDVQGPAHVLEMFWKFCVRWPEIDGGHLVDER